MTIVWPKIDGFFYFSLLLMKIFRTHNVKFTCIYVAISKKNLTFKISLNNRACCLQRLKVSGFLCSCDVCLLPSAGQQVWPYQERAGDVEYQPARCDPPYRHHCSGHPFPLHVHPHHPHWLEADEAPVWLGSRSVPLHENSRFNIFKPNGMQKKKHKWRLNINI